MSISEFTRILIDYLSAAFLHWWFVIVLAALGLISLVEWISRKTIPIPLWAKISFLLVVVSIVQFLAYYDLKVKSAQENTPKLIGRIEQIYIGSVPEFGGSQAWLVMSIRNIGAPSIVEGFTLRIKSQDLDLSIRPTFIPEGYQLIGEEGKPIAVFSRKDAIYEKTVEPVGRGGLVRGWLRYDFKGVEAEKVRETGTKWTISFNDVLNRPYTAVRQMTGGPSGEPQYFPGAEPRFQRLKDKDMEEKPDG